MIFFVIACTVVVFMNYYVYRFFISLLHLPSQWIVVLKLLIVVMGVLELVSLLGFRFKNFPTPLYAVSITFLGISFMLFCVALLYDIFYVALQKFPFDGSRREFFSKFLTYSTLSLTFLYILRGFWGGFKKPKITKINLHVKNLSTQFKIVQLSDVHIGRILKRDFLQDVVDKTNALKPDMVAITGDLVDMDLEDIKSELGALKELKSKYGTYYVAGNHEYYHGVKDILNHLESLGLHVLRNSSKIVNNINISGVYDIAAFRLNHPFKPDIKKALSQIDKNLPTVLLAHQPKYVEYLSEDTKVDLILSGHTHGGQIFPFGFLVKLVQPYLYGLYKHSKNTHIYVSSGAGYWGPAIRFLAPSEIVEITLKPKV